MNLKKLSNKELGKLSKQIDGELNRRETIDRGDKPSDEIAARIQRQSFSFTVHFTRRKALKKVRSPGLVCKSRRRFSSIKEAQHHGKRFTKIHGHKSFKVIRVAQKANAWVNWKTGKTNPVLTR